MRSYLSDKKASEEKTEEKLSAARDHIKPSPSCDAQGRPLQAFKMLHLIGVPVLSLSHPFQAVHSEGPHSCYQTPSGCLVPLVTVRSNHGATVTKENCVQG